MNPDDEDMEPVRKWLNSRNGKLVYSNTEKFRREWNKGGMARWVLERSRANQFKLVSKGVQKKENELKGELRSNDEHIIGLARIADVKLLVSGDRRLIEDFKGQVPRGKVYRTQSHKHLLTRDTCPGK